MKQVNITEYDAGQRLDKFVMRLLPGAEKNFIYKMLRKKNIVLNGKKAEGNELLAANDEIRIFFSDETYEKFRLGGGSAATGPVKVTGPKPEILFENEHILVMNKPAGLLSQKAEADDVSVVEFVAAHLKERGITGVKPSVANRLDRNTSGIILAGISVFGQRELASMLKDRTLEKYYLCVVSGRVEKGGRAEAYITKDEVKNKATVGEEGEKIVTVYRPLAVTGDGTLLEIELVTGKSHQIRAQMAALGFPLAGDVKYGKPQYNAEMKKKYGISRQALHAWRVVFPEGKALEGLDGNEVRAGLPEDIKRFVEKNGIKL